jgi:hypothetical protein
MATDIKHFDYNLELNSFLVEFEDGTKVMGKIEKKITSNLGIVVASFSAYVDFEKSREGIINKDLVMVYSILAKHRIEQRITTDIVKEIKKLK